MKDVDEIYKSNGMFRTDELPIDAPAEENFLTQYAKLFNRVLALDEDSKLNKRKPHPDAQVRNWAERGLSSIRTCLYLINGDQTKQDIANFARQVVEYGLRAGLSPAAPVLLTGSKVRKLQKRREIKANGTVEQKENRAKKIYTEFNRIRKLKPKWGICKVREEAGKAFNLSARQVERLIKPYRA